MAAMSATHHGTKQHGWVGLLCFGDVGVDTKHAPSIQSTIISLGRELIKNKLKKQLENLEAAVDTVLSEKERQSCKIELWDGKTADRVVNSIKDNF